MSETLEHLEQEEAEPGTRSRGKTSRQKPAAFLGGAVLAGFAVGRLAKVGRRQWAERR
jgi:hypothetical protein